jgi:hypothetical protein
MARRYMRVLFIKETNRASDTLDWEPNNAEGACVQAGDLIGRVQIGEFWAQVNNS